MSTPSLALQAKSLQLCPALCDPMDYSLPGSSVHAILQARILECVVMPSSGDLPNPGIEPTPLMSPALAGRFFTTSATREAPFLALLLLLLLSRFSHVRLCATP